MFPVTTKPGAPPVGSAPLFRPLCKRAAGNRDTTTLSDIASVHDATQLHCDKFHSPSIRTLARQNAKGLIVTFAIGITFPVWAKLFTAFLYILWILTGG